MDGMGNLARGVAKRFSAFATLTTKLTIVLAARPAEKFLPIEVCPGSCDQTGRVHSMNSKLSSADRIGGITCPKKKVQEVPIGKIHCCN